MIVEHSKYQFSVISHRLVRSVMKMFLGFILLTSSAISQDSKGLPVVSDDVFGVVSSLLAYDANLPLNPVVVSENDLGYATREKVVFDGVNGSKVPAYLVLPKDIKAPRSAVVIIDGLYGSKERWFEEDSWPRGPQIMRALIEAGFVVMVADALWHGERTHENGFMGPVWLGTHPNSGRHMFIQTAQEQRRLLDYLATRPEVDMENVGALGLSMGGMISFMLSSVEPRFKTIAAGVSPILKDPAAITISPTTFASRARSTSFLMFMGNEDGYYTMDEASEVLERIPTSDKKLVEYDGGHRPPVEYITIVRDWFVERLMSEEPMRGR